MATGDVKRKLTAILSADVNGYSRLMADDEEATVRTINAYREVMTGLIKDHRGRVVDAKGDNVLAEFPSVVDAVRCAVQVQKELTDRNSELPKHRRMEFRIGINLGDVIEEQGTIYGDGVNVAARLEGLAEGGGICISGTTFDQVKNKISVGYEYQGKQSVKNIPDPVRLYNVLLEPEAAGKVIGEDEPRLRKKRWAAFAGIVLLVVLVCAVAIWNFYLRRPSVETADPEKMAFPLPEKPSIAVLPFVNMSEDPNHEYLADGITENIISALSQVPKLFVIARNSAYTYKNKPVKVQKVAEELGVQYVLEGSVQRSDDSLRITAQFIDALSGHHLWSERYDRELKNIFALQDEITIKIITALRVKLTEGELARLSTRGSENLKAYLKLLQARELFFTVTKEGNTQARRLLKEIITLDPEYADAYAFLGATHFMDVPLGISKSPKESLSLALKFTKKALDRDDSLSAAHSLLGWLYTLARQHDKAIAECEKAIELTPNSANANIWMGHILTFAGRHEEAVRYSEKALRLNPRPEEWYYRFLGYTYFGVGNYDEAIAAHKKALQRAPNSILAHEGLTTAYFQAGRLEDARAQAAEVLRINPKYSVEFSGRSLPYKNQIDQERFLDGIRKSGIPEIPPLPLPDKPSIAVLPFVNMSWDSDQEYFSDGITEEIITALSKTPKLFVIARTSSFKYKGKEVDVRTVGRELGVRYVLEGSVRKASDKVRVTAQLIDAKTNEHLWAERYDRDLKDIFGIQDELTMKIITALQVELTEGEQARVVARGTKSLDAYLMSLQASKQTRRMNKDGLTLARQMSMKAIELDPKYAMAYVRLAMTYWFDIPLGLTKSPKQSMAKTMDLLQKALALDNSLSSAHSLLGLLLTLMRQHDKGISECEKAVSLEPNSAGAHYFLGDVLRWAGRHKEALTMINEAIRLNPFPDSHYYQTLTNIHFLVGEYDEAIKAGRKAIHLGPDNLFAHAFLAAAYSQHGQKEEASVEAGEVMRINPKFLIDHWAKTMPYRNPEDLQLMISGLRKAGLK